LVVGARLCEAHQKQAHAEFNARRKEDPRLDDSFYRSKAWRRLRASKLRDDPLCEHCARKGKVVPASIVDHRVAIRRGGEPMEYANLQSLCPSCHSRKSIEEGTAFGHGGI
jgi:5-methylcytosine-specific restriction enzyme A